MEALEHHQSFVFLGNFTLSLIIRKREKEWKENMLEIDIILE